MQSKRIGRSAMFALILTSVAQLAVAQGTAGQSPTPASPGTTSDAPLETQVAAALDLVTRKRPQEGIAILDKVILEYERRYPDKNTDYYCARHMPEQLYYLLQAASGGRKRAVIASFGWAGAYFAKSYALVDLSQVAAARAAIERAIALSPQNAHFLAEYGHILQLQKDWPASLSAFQRSAAAAREFSPEDLRDRELGRALRGQAYDLIELGRLDDAEALLRECLRINPNDTAAKRELAALQANRSGRR